MSFKAQNERNNAAIAKRNELQEPLDAYSLIGGKYFHDITGLEVNADGSYKPEPGEQEWLDEQRMYDEEFDKRWGDIMEDVDDTEVIEPFETLAPTKENIFEGLSAYDVADAIWGHVDMNDIEDELLWNGVPQVWIDKNINEVNTHLKDQTDRFQEWCDESSRKLNS